MKKKRVIKPGFKRKRKVKQLTERFWPKINKSGPWLRNDLGICWEWTGYKDPHGYGRMSSQRGQPNLLAHRVSWEIHYGKIPKGLDCLHRCDNPSCTNPQHLFLGTHLDNMRDMDKKRRRKLNPARGEDVGGSKLSRRDVTDIRCRYDRASYHKSNAEELSKEFGVSRALIIRIINRTVWTHV